MAWSGNMTEIPPFDADGLLPPADYELSFYEIRNSVLVVGPGNGNEHLSWDRNWRERLVGNLEVLTHQLWQVGIRQWNLRQVRQRVGVYFGVSAVPPQRQTEGDCKKSSMEVSHDSQRIRISRGVRPFDRRAETAC